ncbi:hypothetical protein SBA1_530066 [Candidatus Sulfotelmatobacter kueseliae]|uniref:Uncharacterized protein n=1 Tax=Candidatus Sulfotelmatobacter kueseliae TaxID=2042962 RepID=A0A2U3KXV9_9BACT|nr:hypothetical protein SBA1_530066 [Candidatus Sulfotelmatobacter kueseliae]
MSRCHGLAVRKSGIDWKAGRPWVGVYREVRGFEINQATFARLLGVSQGQLSKYRKGNTEVGAALSKPSQLPAPRINN